VKSIPSAHADEKTGTTESETTMTQVQGCVRDPNGVAVEGVRIECFSFRVLNGEEWAWGSSNRHTTDKYGKYAFHVRSSMKYEVYAGGVISTSAASKKFMAEPNEIYQVEDLVVRPATGFLSGVVLDEEGNPVKGLPFEFYSKSFVHFSLENSRTGHTGSNGEFKTINVLPDEPLCLCVLTSNNTAQIWKNLKPSSTGLKLTLNPQKEIKLPPDWRIMGDLRHLSLSNTYVEDSGLNFNLKDLDGNSVSLMGVQYNDKVVLVNIWGTWCGGCLLEVPHLIEMKKKYADRKLEIIGIAFERGDPVQQVDTVKDFVNRKKINYTILLGGSAKHKNVESVMVGLKEFVGFPTTIFIGRDGKVKHLQVGFVCETPDRLAWQVRKMEKKIVELMR
jgi:thiol-disulfide isomerase/thioredoxin/protocatechuate 3,4-dioxygenase beta subunit